MPNVFNFVYGLQYKVGSSGILGGLEVKTFRKYWEKLLKMYNNKARTVFDKNDFVVSN